MAGLQRYVSNELTHFVGRAVRDTPEKCYEILRTILTTGRLTHPPHRLGEDSGLAYHENLWFSKNDKYRAQVICFCDIPVEDFHIHMQKYSRFGLSFGKDYLA
jgi:hypothetical protein